jgi:hypothetical protein
MNLHGKTALVTGSTSGIGLGIAKVLAQAAPSWCSMASATAATPGLKSPRWEDPGYHRRRPARRRADRAMMPCRKHFGGVVS